MLLKYFEPTKDFSWDELDTITNKPTDKWTWPQAGLSWLSTNHYDVVDIELFDYARFMREGENYMRELWGQATVAEQAKHSDIHEAQQDSVGFIENVHYEQRIPQLKDVTHYLNEDYLVMCIINAQVLAGKSGYVGHSILVIDTYAEGFIIHDPGLPPLEYRKVPYDVFQRAWADPNDSAKNLAAAKLIP